MEASHILHSLVSLRSICLKKVAGKDLIDNKELLGLFHATRAVVTDYQRQHQIPEMEIVLERLPDPKTFETRPPAFVAYMYLYEIVLGLVVGVFIFFSPLYGVPLLILLLIVDLIVRLSVYKRNSTIRDALRQVAGACSSIEMLVRNNESYTSVKA